MSSETWPWDEIDWALKSVTSSNERRDEVKRALEAIAAARRSQPEVAQAEREPDWSRFVPTDEQTGGTGSRYVSIDLDGSAWALWNSSCGSEGAAGRRLIRHADGRWADGYNPDGPCMPKCGTRDDEGGA